MLSILYIESSIYWTLGRQAWFMGQPINWGSFSLTPYINQSTKVAVPRYHHGDLLGGTWVKDFSGCFLDSIFEANFMVI